MGPVFLSLGSNLGNRIGYLQSAVDEIGQLRDTSLKRVSRVYETEPVGVPAQPDFLNLALEIETGIRPMELLSELKAIETKVGRIETFRLGPREIDIDIVYYGGEVVNEPTLSIPHIERERRAFVLVPMSELASGFVDPAAGLTVRQLLERCPDRSRVEPYAYSVVLPRKET